MRKRIIETVAITRDTRPAFGQVGKFTTDAVKAPLKKPLIPMSTPLVRLFMRRSRPHKRSAVHWPRPPAEFQDGVVNHKCVTKSAQISGSIWVNGGLQST
jgi:hypothetical protein